jgi:DNA processing protein
MPYQMTILRGDDIPLPLQEIPQPPKELYLLGTMPPAQYIYLTVVGSRKHTSYGREVCQKLIEGLRGYPVVIVSGLALGIDTIAHETALKCGLTTMCFPGSGLDPKVLYPRSNTGLAKRIIDSGGCLVSEFKPDQDAAMWTFPQRNRLMAGIAQATLLVEADEKSGTLITAKLASDYNRDLLVVPGSIFSQASRGVHQFLRLGGTPITCVEDLLEALHLEVKTDQEKTTQELLNASPEEIKILELLHEPIPRDELIRELGMPMTEANALLSLMEIKGLVREELGEMRRS